MVRYFSPSLQRAFVPFTLAGWLIAAAAQAAPSATNPNLSSHLWRKETMSTYKKPSDDVLRKQLTPEQYNVTQKESTEPAFRNAYWDNHEAGIYVDVVSGEPLFSSLDKFDSGTGWPSFTRPLEVGNITTREDRHLLFLKRIEVRSKHADSHLGHVFDDGPAPTGLRYCMNSAALRFIPVAKLSEEGYGNYLAHFQAPKTLPKNDATKGDGHGR